MTKSEYEKRRNECVFITRALIIIILMATLSVFLFNYMICDKEKLGYGGCDKLLLSFTVSYACDTYENSEGYTPCYSYFYMIFASILSVFSFVFCICQIIMYRCVYMKKSTNDEVPLIS